MYFKHYDGFEKKCTRLLGLFTQLVIINLVMAIAFISSIITPREKYFLLLPGCLIVEASAYVSACTR